MYSYQDLIAAYREVGVEQNKVIYWTGDLTPLMKFDRPGKKAVLGAHCDALRELIGSGGTLVVPTGSSLRNTDIPFDTNETGSEMGVFTEYVRQSQGAYRSCHPFVSYAAIGKHAKTVTENVARHAYGPETPEDRMISLDTTSVSVGLHPRLTCSVIHHVEMLMGVPYRYTKGCLHPVVRGGEIMNEPFYEYLWHKETLLGELEASVRLLNKNRNIWSYFTANHELKMVRVGRGRIYAYSMAEFYRCAIELFRDDIYIWLRELPDVRLYYQRN
jgi:aminoglycoside 3-N-acetyltransferase|tara:strand:+ start:3811 stop:4629 length:819 start_codon:yes stop_codon:yes gene_type:complete